LEASNFTGPGVLWAELSTAGNIIWCKREVRKNNLKLHVIFREMYV